MGQRSTQKLGNPIFKSQILMGQRSLQNLGDGSTILTKIGGLLLLSKVFQELEASGFIFFYEEDKNFSVGLFNLLNNPYRKIELPMLGRTQALSILTG